MSITKAIATFSGLTFNHLRMRMEIHNFSRTEKRINQLSSGKILGASLWCVSQIGGLIIFSINNLAKKGRTYILGRRCYSIVGLLCSLALCVCRVEQCGQRVQGRPIVRVEVE